MYCVCTTPAEVPGLVGTGACAGVDAAEDAFMVFLYYSPYRYAYSDKVQGFKVYPTGNYHMEDVWLKQ